MSASGTVRRRASLGIAGLLVGSLTLLVSLSGVGGGGVAGAQETTTTSDETTTTVEPTSTTEDTTTTTEGPTTTSGPTTTDGPTTTKPGDDGRAPGMPPEMEAGRPAAPAAPAGRGAAGSALRPDSSNLPATGSNTMPLTVFGGTLLLAGVILLATTRKALQKAE